MRYQISGKQLDVGEALQTHVKTELSSTVEKYMQRPTDATVVFSKSAHEYFCESTVHLSTGLTAAATGHATEIYAAFDACQEKMDKQLRRHKRRLKDHHSGRSSTPIEFEAAGLYVLASEEEDESTGAEGGDAPAIVAEMETQVPTLSVGEAVMQMEISHKKLLVFRNEKHGGVNVVYHRDDGNVGWIDPRNSK
ncbi:ribosomal subunit interface protein [Thioclava sp. SK-1]|uniref:ribosome hibernation-promoting factor, HPF/YfiA family n=1 Tax=Thioclava sp. SK-1 TaxID=1889770 RepID=UPI000825113F|nr:ribosome-associated translation inhibitor RaiA [Thioclava sp. SK-1]OCX65402.1 ribosomal subunit interface protein [Thioclava sp. SK-1]